VPGRYTIRLAVTGTQGGRPLTSTQPLTLRIDPRVAQDGVTIATLREQLAHNLAVRDLVSDVNRAVYRVREARNRLRDASGAGADTLQKLRAIEARLVTPPIRYSKPELQAQITYLYSMTNGADQKVGRDAIERYQLLRRELDAIAAEINKLLGRDSMTAER
jgi:hypothetical protein